MHQSQQNLQAELTAAGAKVTVGGLYAHYKNPHQYYQVLHLAITERDDQLCVIYQAQYGEKLIFVRPLASWLDTVEWQGQGLARFTPKG